MNSALLSGGKDTKKCDLFSSFQSVLVPLAHMLHYFF